MNGKDIMVNAAEAGFSPEEIQAWSVRTRRDAEAAGFSQVEINDYFGAPRVDINPVRKDLRREFEALDIPEGPEREALTIWDAAKGGAQGSIIGMLKREAAHPDESFILTGDEPWYVRQAAMATQFAFDVPFYAGGAALGVAPGGGYFSALTATAGAFALPAGIRSVLMDTYTNGNVESFSQFWDLLSKAVVEEFKGWTTGAVVATTGAIVGPTAPLLKFPAEVLTMTRVGAVLEGRVAEPQEYLDTAVLLGGIKGTVRVGTKLRETFVRTGKQPRDVVEDAKTDPTIIDDMNSTNQEIPRAYRGADTQAKFDAAVEAGNVKEVQRLGKELGLRPEDLEQLGVEKPEVQAQEAARKLAEVEDTPTGRVLERISIGEDAPKKGWSIHDFYTDWKDRLHPLRQAVNAMSEGKELSVAEDAYLLARLNVGVAGKADHFLEYSPFRSKDFKRVGRPLKQILEPIEENLDAMRAYLVSKRAIDLNKRGIETGIPLEDAKATVTEHAKLLEPIRVELEKYQGHVLNYLRDSEIISKDAYDAMIEANKDYAPFYRVIEDQPTGVGKGLKARDPIKEIKGSERRILDPIESIIKNTYLYITLAERNEIGQAYVKLIEKSPRGAEFGSKAKAPVRPIKLDPREVRKIVGQYTKGKGGEIDEAALRNLLAEELAIFRPGALRPNKNQITVFRKGKRENWEVDPEIAEVFNGMDAAGASILTRFLSVPARLLRAGAIFSPEFIARNPIRDQLSAFIFSGNGFRPFVDFTYGIFDLAKKTDVYQDWLRSGGPMATMVSLDRQYLQKNIRQLMGQASMREKVHNVLKSPIEALAMLSEIAEQGTRVGEFGRGLTKGTRAKEEIRRKGFGSREVTLDFGRIGAKAVNANRVIAFFNAQVEGADKIVRSFRDHPARTSARVVAGITIPSVALYLLNRDEPGWKEIPQWQKDLFWLFPTVDKNGIRKWWRIPKPFEIGIIFGSGAERIAASILEKDPKAFDEFFETMIRGSTPSVVPTAIVPLMEAYMNKSIFLERPLIPASREKWLPEFQHAPYTSELTKAIGRQIARFPGMKRTKAASPIMIDNLIRGWTGGLGKHILDIADAGLRKAGVLPDPPVPSDTLADIPFVKAFVVRHPSAGAQSIADFYKGFLEQQQVIDTIRGLEKEGEPEASFMLHQINQGTLVDASQIYEGMNKMSRFVRVLWRNPDVTPEEKRQIIDETYLQMIEAAKHGNKILEQVEKIQ